MIGMIHKPACTSRVSCREQQSLFRYIATQPRKSIHIVASDGHCSSMRSRMQTRTRYSLLTWCPSLRPWHMATAKDKEITPASPFPEGGS